MKFISTIGIFLVLSVTATAQLVSDIVSTGPAYQDQVWYSMENGEVASAPLNNWDIAFEISGFTASIRANNQKGLEVYQAPYAVGDWEVVDTTGMTASWNRLYNSHTSWSEGALNRYSTSDFDLGWGMYNPITHAVVGDSIQVIKLANGEFKKFRMESLAGGVYTFTFSNLDGSSTTTASIDKSDYSGKNFAYYSIENQEELDREPLTADWDITFCKYISEVQGQPYGVSGVLHNYGVKVNQVEGVEVEEAEPWSGDFQEEINTVGYDWKSFDFMSGEFMITEDLSYFIWTNSGNIYQLVFTGFGGSANGEYEFGFESFSALNTETEWEESLNIFPNPVTNGELNIQGIPSNARLTVFDITGAVVRNIQTNEAERTSINTTGLNPGTYLLSVQGENTARTLKFVIQ